MTDAPLNTDTKLILERANALFARHRNTHYWITVVNDIYDHQFNVFFNIVPRGKRHRSIPLHTLPQYDLGTLETVITDIRRELALTLEFVGFTGMIWPQSGRTIQYQRERLE